MRNTPLILALLAAAGIAAAQAQDAQLAQTAGGATTNASPSSSNPNPGPRASGMPGTAQIQPGATVGSGTTLNGSSNTQSLPVQQGQGQQGQGTTGLARGGSAAGQDATQKTQGQPGMSTAQTMSTTELSPLDRNFATKAAAAGHAEIAAAKLALEKSQNKDVKEFAQRMVDDHGKAGAQLEQIAQQQGLALPTAPDPADQRQMDRMAKMGGQNFDATYIREQQEAHRQAVALFAEESKNGRNPALKQFASETLPTLRGHYDMVTRMAKTAQR